MTTDRRVAPLVTIDSDEALLCAHELRVGALGWIRIDRPDIADHLNALAERLEHDALEISLTKEDQA